MRRTKILATVGPASSDRKTVQRLLEAGANAFRVNFSHGSDEEHRAVLRTLHSVIDRREEPVAIVADLQGPKVRIGDVRGGAVELGEGSAIRLDLRDVPGDSTRLPVAFPEVVRAGRPGDPILLGDGSVELVVERSSAGELQARVVHGGSVTSHTGLFLPTARLRAELLGPKDRADARLALSEGVDFLALSFVRSADDVRRSRRLLDRLVRGKEVGLIAKIERPQALAAIEGILEASDGIMVARGDLGIEVPLERLALEQKRLIAKANAAGRFVIVATQMLLSMLSASRPTRAEATDVANAALDGTDAVMLSEESAVGRYPVQAVEWLARITEASEGSLVRAAPVSRGLSGSRMAQEAAVAHAAVELAANVAASAIVTPTHSGRTAQMVAALRPTVPIIALSSRPSTRRQLALVWGVSCRPLPAHVPLPELRRWAMKTARGVLGLGRGERVVLTAGYPVEGRPTNLVTVVDGDGPTP